MKTVTIGKFHILELIISGFMEIWREREREGEGGDGEIERAFYS